MKRDTPLDYAEFVLTQTRTRGELYISADGVREKLASGYLKPFVTHLREAELQVARGNQVIRLERPPNLSKKYNNTWFTKGTLERFVRFVSTPEVLERIKNIEDELSQLEQVRTALSKTFSQSEVRSPISDTTFYPTGAYQERDGMYMMPRRLSMDADENGSEASKRELLRAMDVRVIALKQEENLAFSHATAAGFDSSNMADLIEFSEHFGAERLWGACFQFIGFSRKKNIPQEMDKELDSPSAVAALSGSEVSLGSGADFELAAEMEGSCPLNLRNSNAWPNGRKGSISDAGKKFDDWNLKAGSQEMKIVSMDSTSVRTRSRWGPPERIQMHCLDPEVCSLHDSEISGKAPEINDQIAHHSYEDDVRGRESGVRPFQAEEGQGTIVLPDSSPSVFEGQKQQGNKKSESVEKGGMFFARLRQMAQQIEARRSGEDVGVHFTSVGITDYLSGCRVSAPGKFSLPLECVWNPSESSHSFMVQDFGDEGVDQPRSQEDKLVPRPPEKIPVGSPHLQSSNSVVILDADHSYLESGIDVDKDNMKKPAEMHAMETQSRKSRDNQEELKSTSARRLSVRAAISLFESKKTNVGEPPSRKLVRQESATDSGGSSTSEKAVLRWSGVGIPSTRDSSTQDKAPDLDTKKPRKNVEISTEKDESTSRKSNLMIYKQAQSAADKNPTNARKVFRNTFLHLTSAQQSAPEADALLSECGPSIQQPSVAVEPFTWPGGDLQKQFKLDLEKSLTRSSRNNVGMDTVFPSKSVADSSKTSDLITKRLPKDSISEIKDEGQSTVNSMVLDVKGRLGHEEERNWTEQNSSSLPGKFALSGPTLAGLSNFKEDKADHRMTSFKQDSLSVKELNIVRLKKETEKTSQTEHKLLSQRFSGKAQQNCSKEPSSILYDTPVDLHMQALVMMIDNHHQTSLNLCDEESSNKQRGRFYEHYQRLRDAKQMKEHPAKRAEREAKLNSMKETLERRKDEMEIGVLRPSKRNFQLVKEQISIGKPQAQKTGLMVTQKEQEELGEEEEGIDQEYQVLYKTSSTSKNHLSTLKEQAAKKTAPTLQKCATASHTSMHIASASSSRAILKNPAGTTSECKMATRGYNGTVDKSINRSVPSLAEFRKEVSKPFSGCSVASLRAYGKVSGHSGTMSDAATLAESVNMVAIDDAEDEEMRCQSPLSRKRHTSALEVRKSSAQAFDQIVLQSFKGHQDVGADSLVNGELCSVVQEVKPFLCKGREIGPGAGPDVMKQKTSPSVDTLKSLDEAVLSDFIVLDEGTEPDSVLREDLNVEALRKPFVPDDLACSAEHTLSMTSIVPSNSSNDDGSPSLNNGQLDGLDLDITGYVLQDASSDERVLSSDELDLGKQENLSAAPMSAAHNLVLGSANHDKRQRVVSMCLSHLLTEKTTEPPQSDSNSSASLQTASQCTTNTYSHAGSSPTNSSASIPSPFSPPPAMLSDSPLGSPASWSSSQTKHPSEADNIPSQRQFSCPQMPVSIVSQLTKELAKGFKRLLYSGRKTLASEAASTDCISASTTSERDDDIEGTKELVRQSSDDLFRREKLQERGFPFGKNGNHCRFQDQGATHSLWRSIPAVPANFKMQEDHLSSGTLLKARRSFFSLSSFWRRGSEGKS